MKQVILAHDLGTSGNKATLFGLDGTLIASSVYEYPTYYPADGFVEQDPEDWWRALCVSTRTLLDSQGLDAGCVAGVSFSGQMMGCLAVGRDGAPLRKSIIWADTRAVRQADEIERALGMEKVYRITGHRVSASYSAAKLMWIRDNEPECFQKTYKLLQAKDYLIFRLTGKFVTDYSDASGTQLFDITEKKWSGELLNALNIPEGMLPQAVPSATVVGGITPAAARECGLLPGTPVVAGGGDGSCACVGAGVVREGKAYNVLGSSSWTAYASRTPFFDPQMRTFNWVHLDPTLYTPCGTMQAAGYSYRWWKNEFCREEAEQGKKTGQGAYPLLEKAAREIPPGCGGALFLPYLLGERAPLWDTDVRGAFLGLSVTSDKAVFTRAVLEGVAFHLKHILEVLCEGAEIGDILLIGGGAKSTLWPQILADVWQRKLLLPGDPEQATSIGAAVCGGVGIGAFKDFSVAEEFNRVRAEVSPDPGAAAVYEKLYPIFREAYESLRGVNARLAAFRA